ncbi:MAG: preprotein translocase subunit SecA [Candidatus Pacebacteria bacterium]|nr:preprotein translocase subunit SecA [Candidatus Paceibacterota bacterium]PIR60615.1 MAG: preprotein translocase subunit SecA [Candidatus Pacebacteria bacterium CG10_big_fil_rev_8_21_14_0_10_44_54]
MLGFFTRLFDSNQKQLDKYQTIVEQINELEPDIKKLSDSKLAIQTKKFKKNIETERESGKDDATILRELLPEVFATVRETSRRVLGMRQFDVQLLAGIALHYSSVTEQKTGEGKTLTVVAPLYLNALLEKGAHLVTVNDYLAELGAGWMGPVYSFLGMQTAVIAHEKSSFYDPTFESEERGDERLEHFKPVSRKEAYFADITYGTNNEFGFDYLRDNMVQSLDQMAQRPNDTHHYAIVDEADSILIDEARTPLIISAPDSQPTKKYYEYSQMVTSLEKGADFAIDEKARSVTLTDLGVKRVEQKLGVKNLYEESFDTIHHIEAALKAKTVFTRDKDYIVRDKQVVIVDEHTGRLMFGRRYSDGLHQAIEAKENVPIQQESRTLATVTIQNYFRQYKKLSGMTGTAVTEAEEFKKIYDIDVLVIPTNVPVRRDDKPDIVYKTAAAKYSAIAAEVEELHKSGQPVLIGTRSIEHNEIVAQFLARKKIPHQVLNAKNHEREAFIIADAGKEGAITVATNIAGRGVDIVLGGSKPELKDYRKSKKIGKPAAADQKLAKELKLAPSINPAHYNLAEYQKAVATWKKSHDAVVKSGGLYILGTERHESRRIDNQLRGRAGRQGDPGASQFFISLEDEIMRIFGGEQISKVMDFLKIEENQPIEHSMIGKSIESAQVKVEGFFFDQRKRLVEFDDVMNKQREIIYQRRRRLLEQADNLHQEISGYVSDEVSSIVSLHAPQQYTDSEFGELVREFSKLIPFDTASQQQLAKELSKKNTTEEIIEELSNLANRAYKTREKQFGTKQMRFLERVISLTTLDERWMDHLDAMEGLRDGIWLRGDKQTVLSEYKKEAFSMFSQLVGSIESTIASRIFRVQPRDSTTQNAVPTRMIEHKDDINESLTKEVADAAIPTPAGQTTSGSTGDLAAALGSAKAQAKPLPGSKKIKIGRNDPCPCGSGLKYKKCGLIQAQEHRA